MNKKRIDKLEKMTRGNLYEYIAQLEAALQEISQYPNMAPYLAGIARDALAAGKEPAK